MGAPESVAHQPLPPHAAHPRTAPALDTPASWRVPLSQVAQGYSSCPFLGAALHSPWSGWVLGGSLMSNHITAECQAFSSLPHLPCHPRPAPKPWMQQWHMLLWLDAASIAQDQSGPWSCTRLSPSRGLPLPPTPLALFYCSLPTSAPLRYLPPWGEFPAICSVPSTGERLSPQQLHCALLSGHSPGTQTHSLQCQQLLPAYMVCKVLWDSVTRPVPQGQPLCPWW